VEKSLSLAELENELEAYAPIIKCETKCEKTYYKCPIRNRFECPMVVRTVREVLTGLILIETCAMSHCHHDSNEKFQRGLSVLVQESIREIAKFNVNIKPRTLHGSLLMDPYNFSGGDIPINKVASYLHRIRACASSSYTEYSVSGLCAMIEARQRCDYSRNISKFFFIERAEKSIQFSGSENLRVQVFITTDTLLQNVQCVCNSADVCNIFPLERVCPRGNRARSSSRNKGEREWVARRARKKLR
jgi:hypothetical protein